MFRLKFPVTISIRKALSSSSYAIVKNTCADIHTNIHIYVYVCVCESVCVCVSERVSEMGEREMFIPVLRETM